MKIRKTKRSLLEVVQNSPELRRLFGKRELEIIQKQLLGIQLMPSEQMRLSRDIMAKFRAIKSLSDFDESDFKKGAHIKMQIEEIKEEILESKYFSKIKCIYLYGSTAINQRSIRSDIDIAVEFDSISKKEAFDFSVKFNQNDKIDVKVFNNLPSEIKNDIKKFGKIIWKKKTK